MGEEMVRHVFLVEDRLVARDVADESGDGLAPVWLVMGDDLGRAGVVEAGMLQVVSIQGLVADERVGAVAPGAHQRSGDVARTLTT